MRADLFGIIRNRFCALGAVFWLNIFFISQPSRSFFLLHSIHKFVLSLKSDVTEKEKSLFYTYIWIEIKTFYMLYFNFINKLAENLPFLILKLSITFGCAGLNFVVPDWSCCDKNHTDQWKKYKLRPSEVLNKC